MILNAKPALQGRGQQFSPEEISALIGMLAERHEHFSAARLRTTTMVMRRLTEIGLVEMSLSKQGVPFYTLTEEGERQAVSNW